MKRCGFYWVCQPKVKGLFIVKIEGDLISFIGDTARYNLEEYKKANNLTLIRKIEEPIVNPEANDLARLGIFSKLNNERTLRRAGGYEETKKDWWCNRCGCGSDCMECGSCGGSCNRCLTC